ncbi:MAG TPA: pirin-like C-terminal cupin domain-containing protein [Polyangiaceae bacterium]
MTMTASTEIRTANSVDTAPGGRRRSIEGVYRPPALHWVGDGFRVAGYFSHIPAAFEKLSPFLLLDYHPPYDYAPSARPRGVGVHPHRGFETVTIAWEGSVAHHDSAGGGGVIGPGDAQWMTAASGILHKEYHEENFARRGGTFHMAQLWVNLPQAHKADPPRYQAITADRMGSVTLPDGAGSVRVLAGEFRGARGPALTFTPIDVYDVRLNDQGTVDLDFPARHNLAVLVMKGDATFNGTAVTVHDFAVFENDGERLHVEADGEVQLLVLSGEPIDEPVVAYGPFVMNTQAEVMTAFRDFQSGKFGYLADDEE